MNQPGPSESWVELTTRVDVADADLVADALTSMAPGGVVEEPSIRPRDDADFAYDLLDEPTVLRAFFPAPVDAWTRRDVRRRLASLPLQATLRRLRWTVMTPVEWVEEWRRFYVPIEVGERLLLCPSWLEPPSSERMVITLDPGAAFGTGQHATTRLCLAAVEWAHVEGGAVLDVGCGSGLLAIAAAKLGARAVLGCDIDEHAVEIARQNAEANGVGPRLDLLVGSVDVARQRAPFDVIVANISSTVAVELAGPMAALLAPGGRVILGGFLARDRDEVAAAAVAAGLELRDEATEEGWCVLMGVRP